MSEGMGVVKQTENLTTNDENEFWEKGVINKTTSKGLSYGVFFYNSKVFGLRGVSKHRPQGRAIYCFKWSNCLPGICF